MYGEFTLTLNWTGIFLCCVGLLCQIGCIFFMNKGPIRAVLMTTLLIVIVVGGFKMISYHYTDINGTHLPAGLAIDSETGYAAQNTLDALAGCNLFVSEDQHALDGIQVKGCKWYDALQLLICCPPNRAVYYVDLPASESEPARRAHLCLRPGLHPAEEPAPPPPPNESAGK